MRLGWSCRFISLTLGLGFILGLAWPLAAAPAPVAELIGLQGQAEVRKVGAAAFSPAVLLQKFFPQEACRTLAHSKAKLLFVEQSILVLGERTTIEISDYAASPTEPRWQRQLKLLVGRLRLLVYRFRGQDPELTLDLPTLAVAVRGTDLFVDSRPGEDRVYLYRARRPLQLRHKVTGEVVELPVGFEAISRRLGPLQIRPWPPEQQQELLRDLSLFFEVRPRPLEPNHLDSNKGYAPIQPGEFTKPGVMPVYQPPAPTPPAPGANY